MWQVVQADARSLPLDDGSVDLIVTSPPYWGLRSYRDGGEHYSGQVGSEDSPLQYVDELVTMIDSEWRRVLKPSGSLWLNLGDKYAGSGSSGTTSGLGAEPNLTRGGSTNYPKGFEVARPKSLLGLPWRVALGLIDRGWILRAEVIWSKPNGLPESVKDRVRRSHEQWFHFTLNERYFSAVDEIREPHAEVGMKRVLSDFNPNPDHPTVHTSGDMERWLSPLGRLPGSVRSVPTQPLIIPDTAKQRLGLTDHYAAFPMEWPRWIITGWSPKEVCTVCGEGRRPVTERHFDGEPNHREAEKQQERVATMTGGTANVTLGRTDEIDRRIVGYACACPDTSAPSTPAVVLDPFGGTGTTAGVAHLLGRHGISVDLSADYCRLAEWRIGESGDFERFAYGKRPDPVLDGQETLW